MFVPNSIFYENAIKTFPLGKELLECYQKLNIPMFVIDNHNNIPEMRSKQNVDFPKLKQNLIIGIRKTHKFVPNNKISDYLVPYTSSRLYCYVYVLLLSL